MSYAEDQEIVRISRIGKLYHDSLDTKDDFFKRIDSLGGWPVGKKYVQRYHSDARLCEFANDYIRNEWWTTDYDADDYYLWKLSPGAIERISKKAADKIIDRIRSMT